MIEKKSEFEDRYRQQDQVHERKMLEMQDNLYSQVYNIVIYRPLTTGGKLLEHLAAGNASICSSH